MSLNFPIPFPFLPFASLLCLPLSNPPNTICSHHTIPPLPSLPLSNPPNTICCQHTIPPLPSLPTLHPIPLKQAAVNTQFPLSLHFQHFIQSFSHKLLSTHNSPTPFPSHPLSKPPNTICCHHTIPPLPSLHTLYPIPLTQSAVNTQFPHSLSFPSHPLTNHLTQSPVNIQFPHSLPFPHFIQST